MALASVQMQVSQILIKYLTTKQPNQTINVLFYYCLSYNLSLFKIDSTYLFDIAEKTQILNVNLCSPNNKNKQPIITRDTKTS